MTNSHPDKSDYISLTSGNIKANGIDSLVISFNGVWKNLAWFSYFTDLKKEAQEKSLDVPGAIKTEPSGIEWAFIMKPNGSQGFAWLLIGNDFTLRIGQWAESKSRPNVMAEIRSEMLWRVGAQEACSYIINLLVDMGLEIEVVKPSRVDLCLDILFPKIAWNKNLIDYAVTKASDRAFYLRNAHQTTGMSFGKGDIMARLYDKELEIKQKSNKMWMFDIWGIKEIPKDKIMVRIEYQLRREILKDVGVNTLTDLFEKQQNVWAYCTNSWLKFQDNIELHREKRNNMKWWQVIQEGYSKAQGANPSIREHIYKLDMERLTRQAYGIILSLIACHLELTNEKTERIEIGKFLYIFLDSLNSIGKNEQEMNEKIHERRTKFKRIAEGASE
jgi:hypothetical protein